MRSAPTDSILLRCSPADFTLLRCSPTDFTDLHRLSGCVVSPTEFTEFTEVWCKKIPQISQILTDCWCSLLNFPYLCKSV